MTHDPSVAADPVGMLAEEFVARYRDGERPPLSEYTDKYPEHAERIRQLFPMLVVMEQAGSGVTADATCDHAAAADGTRPEVVGGYRVLREVGRGGMGVVYEAEQLALGRRVALKVLPRSAAANGSGLERFRREAKAAARLHHTNIVPVYEVGQDGGLDFYAMQFIQGQPLDEILQELQRTRAAISPRPEPDAPARDETATLAGASGSGRLGRGETSSFSLLADQPHAAYHRSVARVGVQVAEALEYAHREGVVHRDIKPSNLLLDAEARVWVSDFGLAKTQDHALTDTGDIVGTIRYMAPERFRGACDARSDVYALGLTLYELLTLRPAFTATDRLTLIDQIARLEPPRPRSLDPRIPRDLETIVMTAIDKDPCRRYPSAEHMAADLRRFLADEPITARRRGPAERLARWARRNPVVASLTAAVIIVAACGFAATAAQMRAAQVERDEVRALNDRLQRTLYTTHMNLAQHAWDAGGTERTLDLLEQHRPKAGEADLRRFEWYYLDRLYHSGLLTLKGHTDTVLSVVFSSDGKCLASASQREVKVWDAQTGLELRTLSGLVRCMAFSPDGTRLAIAGAEAVKVWDAQTGQEIQTFKGGPASAPIGMRFSDDPFFFSMAFSPDSKRLASPNGREVKVWDVQTGKEVQTLPNRAFVRAVAFSPDGQHLASGSADRTVKLWDVNTGKELRTLQGLTGAVVCVAFSPDGQRVAGGCVAGRVGQKNVIVWDAQTGQELQTYTGHPGLVNSVAFSLDGQRLASAGRNGTFRVWEVQTGKELLAIRCRSLVDSASNVALSPNGQRLASASDREVKVRVVNVWDAQTDQEAVTLRGHTGPVTGVACSPDGQRLASASGDGSVKVWIAQTGQEVHSLQGHLGFVTCVVFSPDGQRLASASEDRTLKLWDVQTGQELRTFRGHTFDVNSVIFSPDGQCLASTSWDGTIRVWDAQTGQELLTLGEKRPTRAFVNVAFSPDGKRLAFASGQEMKLWDAQTGQEVLALKGQIKADTGGSHMIRVAFSRDGKHLACSSGPDVKVWDTQTGQELLTLKGHIDGVRCVAFSPDGRRLASGSGDTTVKVWDVQTGQESLTLKGHAWAVNGVAFSPDGHRLVSGSVDNTIKIWDATPRPEKP